MLPRSGGGERHNSWSKQTLDTTGEQQSVQTQIKGILEGNLATAAGEPRGSPTGEPLHPPTGEPQ